jgi:hypothetical protein
MTQVEQLASFVSRARYDDLSADARQQLKIRIIDALGCAFGALEGQPISMLRAHLDDFGGNPLASLIGGGKTRLTAQRCITRPWYAIWTTTTAISPNRKPATPATAWEQCWPPASMQSRAAKHF